MKNRFLCLLVSMALSAVLFAGVRVEGVVMAEGEAEPVIGANVVIQGTSNGTVTDYDGKFSLDAEPDQMIEISFIGYVTQAYKASKMPQKVTLVADNVMLDEVVAIGYGTMRKSDVTGAVTSVDKDELARAPVSGVDQALQGRAAGVTVMTGSGQPGQAATIRIRGIGSAIGGNDPLYVVDGVITSDISFLSPQDIQSMEILKDASAAAIYGSRGANGVILITTRTGSDSEKKPNINVDMYWGIQNRWKKLDLLSASDQALTKLRVDAMKNGASQLADYMNDGFNGWMSAWNLGSSAYYPVVQSQKYPNGLDYSSINTDWQDEVFKKNAFMHNYNVSVDGGGEKGHYAFSANYFSQDGTIIGSNYERLTLRLNSDFNVRKWLTIGEHLSFVNSTGRNAMNNSSSPGASVISAALAMAPWDPTHYPEGSVNAQGDDLSGRIAASSNFKNVTNPFTMVEESHPENKVERWIGDLYLEIKPVEGLVIRPSISIDYSLHRDKTFKGAYDYSSYDRATKNFISSSMTRYCSLLEETTATYAKKIKKHHFSVMLGQTWQEWNQYGLSGSGASILNPIESNWYLSNATEDRTESADNVARIRRMSFLGRVFYSYDERYMATVNFRADASSRFSKNPWGFFPSVALAWRMSQERWLKDVSWLDNLKIRAGWGQVGNDGIPSGSFTQTITTTNNVFVGYPLGLNQDVSYGAAVLTQVNLDGKWETNEQLDAGVDFSFWRGMLSGTIDYYRRNTIDALLYVNSPAQVGNRYSLIKNVGNIRNEGVELTLNHDNKVGKVHYNIGGNISFVKNELTKLNGGSPLWGDRTKTDQGMALNSFWGYEYEGVYQSDEEALSHLYSYTKETIGVHAGDARYKDQNGDGKIDGEDQVCIGNPFPKLTYGINMGAEFYGVDVQLFFQGVYGNQIYNALRERTEGAGDECTLAGYMANDVWVGYTDEVRLSMDTKGLNWMQLENRSGSIPNPLGSPMNMANSSRFIEDGSYFRLKNLQIGYTFPKQWTNKFYCQRLRLYLTASNLFTITKYKGYDPEVGSGVDYGNYPQSRTFTFGLNLTF